MSSLGPIKSIAGSLDALLQRDPPPPDLGDDLRRGLQVIGSRADALSRFTGAYTRLAKLPSPRLARSCSKPQVQRVAGLERRVPVSVRPGPDVTVNADSDQLEQLLINLVKNGAEATLKAGGSGIGLVLCRQIAEAHGGSISLEAAASGAGCRATLTPPI